MIYSRTILHSGRRTGPFSTAGNPTKAHSWDTAQGFYYEGENVLRININKYSMNIDVLIHALTTE